MMKQNTETNITQPCSMESGILEDATRIHTRPPKICKIKEGGRVSVG